MRRDGCDNLELSQEKLRMAIDSGCAVLIPSFLAGIEAAEIMLRFKGLFLVLGVDADGDRAVIHEGDLHVSTEHPGADRASYRL